MCAPKSLYETPKREIHDSLIRQDIRTYGDYMLDAAECNAALKFTTQRLNELRKWGQSNGCE